MDVIFLDFDGVIVTKNSMAKDMGETTFHPFDKDCVAILNQIVKETGASVVVSSSWRVTWKLEELNKMGKANGFEFEMISITPNLFTFENAPPRSAEINAWLKEHSEVKCFVAIDDMEEEFDGMLNHLIRTEFEKGLQDWHVEDVVRRFRGLKRMQEKDLTN